MKITREESVNDGNVTVLLKYVELRVLLFSRARHKTIETSTFLK